MPPRKYKKLEIKVDQPVDEPVDHPIKKSQLYSILLSIAVKVKPIASKMVDLTLQCLAQTCDYDEKRLQAVNSKTRTILVNKICPSPNRNASVHDIHELKIIEQILAPYPQNATAIIIDTDHYIIPFKSPDGKIEMKELKVIQWKCSCFQEGFVVCQCRTNINVEQSITTPAAPFNNIKLFIQQRPIDAIRLLYNSFGYEKTVRYIDLAFPELFSLSRFIIKEKKRFVFDQEALRQYALQNSAHQKYLELLDQHMPKIPKDLTRIIMDYDNGYIRVYSIYEITKAYYARS